MELSDAERTKRTARDLVELLAAYDQELAVLERDTSAAAPLHRAIEAALAQACRVLSDRTVDDDTVRLSAPSRSWTAPS